MPVQKKSLTNAAPAAKPTKNAVKIAAPASSQATTALRAISAKKSVTAMKGISAMKAISAKVAR